ncbi:purinergic receptor P2X, ligand-gated ion channel, partial [Cichlidogyrus casuarinus]
MTGQTGSKRQECATDTMESAKPRGVCRDQFISFLKETMFIYETPKVVLIQSPKIGFIFRFIQVGILIYFIMWIMMKERGYQKKDKAISGVTTEVRGLAWTNLDPSAVIYASGPRIWDNGDYSIPPQQNAGFFVVTRISAMIEQTMSACAESYALPDARCRDDSDCRKGYIAGKNITDVWGRKTPVNEIELDYDGHGPFTGKCLNHTHTCEIFAWCPIYDPQKLRNDWKRDGRNSSDPNIVPLQQDRDEKFAFFEDLDFLQKRQKLYENIGPTNDRSPPFYDALNFTVYIKNSIEFPLYKVKRRNILPDFTPGYLDECVYNESDARDKYCPVLNLGYIINKTEADPYRLLRYGGVISITIDWDCNLDRSEDECLPKYGFKQLDSPPEDK